MSLYRVEDKVNLERMRRERKERAREQMKKDGIGAYLCLGQGNIKYITDTYSSFVPAFFYNRNTLFPRTGEPILYEWGSRFARVRDELAPWLNGNVKPGWRLGAHLMSGVEPKEFLDDLRKVLGEHDVLNEPLGIDMPAVTLNFSEIFKKAGFNIVDASASLGRARMVKTKDELECMRISTAITEEIFDAVRRAIRPGIRESDLAAIVNDVAISRGADGPTEPNICSGENTHPNMMHYNMRPIRPGDMIFADIHMKWRGYHSCVYRTFTCGRATQRQKEIYEETRNLTYKAIEKVKAGVTTADIVSVWPGPEHWGWKTWRECTENAIGHGIGLDLHESPYITPLFSPHHPVKLEENMTIALETYFGDIPMTGPGQGARTEEDLIVTKDGCEILTKWPIDEITEAWI
jgi:Xaa-Pro aminopeptidase